MSQHQNLWMQNSSQTWLCVCVCVCVCVTVWQREAGVQRLSSHFSWPEFCDERRHFHQEFVYDVAMFAAARGFPWPDVIRAAAMAKGIFPQLDGQSKCTVHAEALQVTQCFTWRSWSHTFKTANRESTMFPETEKKLYLPVMLNRSLPVPSDSVCDYLF